MFASLSESSCEVDNEEEAEEAKVGTAAEPEEERRGTTMPAKARRAGLGARALLPTHRASCPASDLASEGVIIPSGKPQSMMTFRE